MSAPEPRANPNLLGHAAAEATLIGAMAAARMHHAWLITGAEGVGKATLAFRFARWLLAGAPAGDSLAVSSSNPVFNRVAAGTHADLLTIELMYDTKAKRMKTQIAVEDARRVGPFLHLTAAEGGWRVVVIDGAEDLNPSSANALLKILEEPPSRAVLLLVCAAPGRLLPTIRSRCRLLRLEGLDNAAIDRLLGDYLPELGAADRSRLAGLAEGSPGRALTLAGGAGLACSVLVDEVLAALPDFRASRAYAMADTVTRRDSNGEAKFSTFMEVLRTAIATALCETVRGTADATQARLIATHPIEAWPEMWHALTKLQDETERYNLDQRQAIVAGIGLLCETNLLRHDADLLRQWRAAYRPRLHLGRGRCSGAIQAARRVRRVFPDRHRRARSEG
jgi:DNA polymerase-3 subunit delta'